MENQEQFERLAALGCHLVQFEEFRIEGELGSGGFGDVHSAVHVRSGTPCAIKTLRKQELTGRDLTMFLRELEALLRFRNPFLLSAIGYCDSAPFAIVTEVMPGGNLTQALRGGIDGTPLSATQLSLIALGVADGMRALHSAGLVHRDLKSGNILLDKHLFPKICDFGIARPRGGLQTQRIGTLSWMAPEAMLSKEYDEKVDVYSYAIVLWELLARELPWRACTQAQVVQKVAIERARPLIPRGTPPELADLIAQCWAQDPHERPTFDYIYHAFRSCCVLFPGTDEGFYLRQMQVMDDLHGEVSENPLLTVKRGRRVECALAAPADFVEMGLPEAPTVAKIAVKTWPEILRVDGEYGGNFTDFELLKGYIWQYPVLIEVKRKGEHELGFLDGFVQAGGILHLNYSLKESYELLRFAMKRNLNVAREVNWAIMCDVGIGFFADMVLHLFSIAAQIGEFDQDIFGPLLNHYHDFFVPRFASSFGRILQALYEFSHAKTIEQIFVVGVYSAQVEVVEVFLKLLCANNLCNEIDSRILEWHFEHLANPQLLISVLLRRDGSSEAWIPFLTANIQASQGAVFLLCQLAESSEGADCLLKDLTWLQFDDALPIALILMRSPSAQAMIEASPHFPRLERIMVEYSTDEGA
jgi:hypothetical protein